MVDSPVLQAELAARTADDGSSGWGHIEGDELDELREAEAQLTRTVIRLNGEVGELSANLEASRRSYDTLHERFNEKCNEVRRLERQIAHPEAFIGD